MAYTPTIPATYVSGTLPVMLDAETAASILGVSSKHVRDLAREKAIPAIKVGSAWRIPRDKLLAQFGLA